METLVDIVANIPYMEYNYQGDIVYTYIGTVYVEPADRFLPPELVPPELRLQNEKKIVTNYNFIEEGNNSVYYIFFGGTCFELLNDAYKNVNLYDFVDPTSDIDIVVSSIMPNYSKHDTNEDIRKKLMLKHNVFDDIDSNVFLVVNKSLEEPDLIPYLNPYFRNLSDFIFENMLTKLNLINLNFTNSVPFDVNEYTSAENEVKHEVLGYRVHDIQNSNAKLIRYLDSDLNTLRIQIILKVVVDGEIIIDHLLEFLVNGAIKRFPETWEFGKITIPVQPRSRLEGQTIIPVQPRSRLEGQTITISSLTTLIDDNLEAYKKREREVHVEGPRRHKPINHITRIIYLLNLIKYNPDVYDRFHDAQKRLIYLSILKNIVPSYVYYKIINDEFVINTINTIDIIYAFYTLFVNKLMMTHYAPNNLQILSKKIKHTISEIPVNKEEEYYNSLMTLFRMNASPFRKIISRQVPQKSSETQFMNKMRSRELDELDVDKAFKEEQQQKAFKEEQQQKEEYTGDFSDGKDKIIMSTGTPPNYGGRKTRRKKRKNTHRKKEKRKHKKTHRRQKKQKKTKNK
jgi:hypothetical protein